MAASSCLRCGHGAFEKVEATISGLRFTRDFVQCAGCGGVVGVIESDDWIARLDSIESLLRTPARRPTSPVARGPAPRP